jgi:hypothetical protein
MFSQNNNLVHINIRKKKTGIKKSFYQFEFFAKKNIPSLR